jgi:fatty-acid desaturase
MIALGVMHTLAVVSVPYILIYGLSVAEVCFHILAYLFGGLGITALYHRSWTHNAVKFHRILEYFMAAASTFVLQMPARQWISNHIKHHKFTDEEADPHNIKKGFWCGGEGYYCPRSDLLSFAILFSPLTLFATSSVANGLQPLFPRAMSGGFHLR